MLGGPLFGEGAHIAYWIIWHCLSCHLTNLKIKLICHQNRLQILHYDVTMFGQHCLPACLICPT